MSLSVNGDEDFFGIRRDAGVPALCIGIPST